MTKNTFPLRMSKTILYGFAFVILILLTVMSLMYSFDVMNEDFQFITQRHVTSIWLTLGVSVAAMILLSCIAIGLDKLLGKKSKIYLLVVSFLWMVGICAWWIVNAKVAPGGDSRSLYDIAVRALGGDLAPVAPTGSYLALCPHQTGLLLYFELILRVFPGADYMSIQWVNMVLLSLGYVAAYFTVQKWFDNTVISNLWCMLMMCMLPLYFLVNMVYGDIPGLALMCIATCLFQYWFSTSKWYYLAAGGIFACGAVAVRKNYAIFIIAVILISLVYAWAEKKIRYLIGVLPMILAIVIAGTVPTKIYEHRANNTLEEGIPTISYVVMGLNHVGWNGYHSDLYLACDYDEEKAERISKEDLKNTLQRMSQNPGEALSFFWEKQSLQWANPSYAYVVSTVYSFDEGRTNAAWEVYSGDWKDKWNPFMDVVQSVLYLGALLYVLELIVSKEIKENKVKLCTFVWLVAVIGGFVFSLVWEGGARYNLPYAVALIPYAATGIFGLSGVIAKMVKNACK